MKKVWAILLCIIILLSFSGCDANLNTDIENSHNGENTNLTQTKYIIQTPFYQIYEESPQTYKYRIAIGNHTLIEDIKTGTAPEIEEKGNGIIRLFLGNGTNAFAVKYFNVYEKTASNEFHPYTIYADYTDTVKKEYYIAYFQPEEKPKLYIKGFFESSDFSNELDLNFSMATCEKLIFLNETQLYIEYVDNNSNSVKKVVNFKN